MPTEHNASEYPGGAQALLEQVRKASPLEGLCGGEVTVLARGKLRSYAAGEEIISMGAEVHEFLVMLEGKARVERDLPPEYCSVPYLVEHETSGDTPLMSGRPSVVRVTAETEVLGLVISEPDFWKLMEQCPAMRSALIGRLAARVQDYQTVAIEREKMISIGTLTAGLMHELNNPGTAAMRATGQLRANLRSLQELSMKLSGEAGSPEEKGCINSLVTRLFTPCTEKCDLSTLESSDRADALSDWLSDAGIEDAWKIGPALSDAGLDRDMLECAHTVLSEEKFSDALHWLEALVSSVKLLETVETSMQRINDLVAAVKTYSSGASGKVDVDIHDTLKAAFIIVLHKIRQKNISIEKVYTPGMPKIRLYAPAITQVWTNLLDNAADAVSEGGKITLRTRLVADRVLVEIEDNGSGIPQEILPHIFEAFYTTKEAGKGTGLGLDIVMRNVRRMGGDISVESEPNRTVFRILLPLTMADALVKETAPAQEQLVPVH